MTDKEFLSWIYDRMIYKHGENKNVDYMLKFRSIIDSMQEEPVSDIDAYQNRWGKSNGYLKGPVSIWHDGCEIPKSGTNILMIRKDKEDPDYPPIAGCFHGTNFRLDGKNWGYYNGFCYNEIEPPVKWIYIDDILNLSKYKR